MKISRILLAAVILGSVLCVTEYSDDFSQNEFKIAADRVGA
ncbi:phosphatase [Bacillus inaquosorum]|nr:phosphatase [Bacillus inaquosorum]MCY8357577.1 phosphatase [Bacillus inaquosorum]